ncbi:carbohydrate-binding protein [Gilvimarinus sp. DA14]|uniref:rhamnogalacturonan lyase family protein n=1 Tax=Gilvimarinus sp. DA14 TaxID=2956798 RepID=UPI0020B826D8|nr:carbohydrate-binding protein [Gilvimarinus sp. DA14]UTF60412.1 carbohydrate-binding protein [Gilvimarinus sp. DA14]
MRKDGRYFKGKRYTSAARFVPLALTAMLAACGSDDYTPAEPYEAPPPEDVERDTTGSSNVEYLDRGLVVLPAEDGGNVLSWRWSGLDEQRIRFEVYKNDEFFRTVRPGEPTFLEDINGQAGDSYQVVATVDGEEKDSSDVVQVQEKSYLSIPLNKPANGFVDGVEYSYIANDASAADLTGDGQYELILKWEPDNAKDNSQGGKTGDVLIDAYTLEGELLWRINLGHNIRAGAHYTQFIAYDFNQDGRAEVAMKTADGTVDGRGTVIGDADADYRNDGGYVLDGPEFLTMFEGATGEALSTVDYIPPRGDDINAIWGDDYGNRVDRFLAGVAYLDGKTPSLVISRGYYTRAVVATYNFDGNNLTQNWVYDSNNDTGASLAGQGAHSLSVADVDSDGADEIIFGAATLDNDGSVLYSTGLGHGDALHVTDIIPGNDGLEIFMVHESSGAYITDEGNFGVEVHDAATGEILISQPSNGEGDDVGRGVTGDIDPNYPGMESWGSRGGLMAADGSIISENKPAMNFMVWWDGDLNREMLDGTEITKWNSESLLVEKEPLFNAGTFSNGLAVSNNGTKATPALSADILGDWREEVVLANESSTRLMIYSSNIPTDIRLPTLMHDRQYRTAIAWQNVGYNQPPHPSFYMGSDMELYDHVIKELPQFKTQAVAGQAATGVTVQGNNDNILVKVFPGDAALGSATIFRATVNDRSAATEVGMLEGGQTSFVDETAVPDVTYYYWVEADIAGLDGAYEARMTSTLIPRVAVASMDNYVDLTWATSLNLSDVYIYRAPTDEEGMVPEKPTSSYAQVNGKARTWSDAGTEEGQKYYYWVELVTAAGDSIVADPVFGENLVVPKTNLNATYENGVLNVCWNLENVEPGATYNELYRNDQNQAGGRTRIYPISDPAVIYDGCFEDVGPEGGFPEGQGYWYMFKQVGNTEIVGPFGNGLASNVTNLSAELDPLLGTINVTWNLWNFGQDIVNVDLYRNTSASMSGRTLVREDVRARDGRLRDTGGNDGFVEGETYWYSFEVLLADNTVINTDPEGEVLFELPAPETNLITRLEDGGIRIDWNLENFQGEMSQIELLRNTEASDQGAMVVASEELEPRGVYAEYDGLVEGQTYWYMMRVTMANGDIITGEALGEIVYEANPTTTSVTINENEDGYCEISNGAIESNWAGFEGDGFSNTDNAEGEFISYKVNIQEAGTYRFLLRYANGAGDNRFALVDINSQIGAATIDMESTSGWDVWMETHVDVELEPGETDIKLRAGSGGGLGNVDYLFIDALTTDSAPQRIACAP